jgi:N-acetylglutamate synthase-like GNAT family acetyltransferase
LGGSFPKSFYLQFLYDSSASCIVAEDANGQIIGCGTAKVSKRQIEYEGNVLTLAVIPAWRRKGVGRDILEVTVFAIALIF